MDYSVIIIGGVPSGLSTALHLQRIAPHLVSSPQGATRVLILEKERYPRFKLCAGGLTIDRAVDVFLAEPTVVELLATAGEDGVLVGVTREGPIWRMSLGSAAGDLSAEVHPDLTVREVDLLTPSA